MLIPRSVIAHLLLVASLCCVGCVSTFAQFEEIKNSIKEHTLANGMKFIVCEQHHAPVVSFNICANVGSANETPGITGISHLLEHLAFKGSHIVGTKDFEREKVLLERVDRLFDKLVRARAEAYPDTGLIKSLTYECERANDQAAALVEVGEFGDLYVVHGSVGFNAYTSNDLTHYVVSLPSNKLELWMAMESDRFMNPVFRQMFEERDVVMEERRLRISSQPSSKLDEDFLATAFKAHPYGQPAIGNMSDLERITRKDVEDYFRRYYGPSNLTAAVVGDVQSEEVFRLAELYFGRIPTSPEPEPLRTVEPPQWGERRVTVTARSRPVLMVGYHQPESPKDLNLHALATILGRGRSSRLYKALVIEQQIAVGVYVSTGYPGGKYPSLFLITAIPAEGHTAEECLAAIEAELDTLKERLVSDQELTKHKRRVVRAIMDRNRNNGMMAHALTWFEVVQGDWRNAFDVVHDIESVTPKDIRRDVRQYLVDQNRTVGILVSSNN